MPITAVDQTRPSFTRSFSALPNDIAELAIEAITDLLKSPPPARLRLHKLGGYKNPKIFTIDITSNHSHKISLEIDGNIAILRKAGTHKEIDRAP